jgi:RNA polymerase sigma-32 factor
MYQDSIETLARFAKSKPLLTADQEVELYTRIQAGDKGARKVMTEHNIRLVLKLANDHCRRADQLPDLVAEGMVGLCEAVDTFDPSKGRFSTHATFAIRAKILAFVVTVRGDLSVNPTIYWRLRNTQDQLESEGLDADPDSVASARNGDKYAARTVLGSREISTAIPLDSEAESSSTVGDYLEGDIPDPESVWASAGAMDRLMDHVNRFRESLSDKEAAMLDNRILSADPMTLQEVGDLFGSSREAMRQIENRVRGKLQTYLSVGNRLETIRD